MTRLLLVLPLAFVIAACPPEPGPGTDEGDAQVGSPRDAGGLDGAMNSGAASVATVGGCPAYGYYDGCNYCSATGCTARACRDEDGGVTMPEPMCQVIYYALPDPVDGNWVCGDEGYVFHSSCVPTSP